MFSSARPALFLSPSPLQATGHRPTRCCPRSVLLSGPRVMLWSLLTFVCALAVASPVAPQRQQQYVDAGLQYFSILPSAQEWESSFPGREPGVVHLWAKCLDSTLRAFFWVESSDMFDAQLRSVWDQAHTAVNRTHNLTFSINRQPANSQRLSNDGRGGGEFFASVTHHSPEPSVLLIGVAGWRRTVDFPLWLCGRRLPPVGNRTRVMNVHTQWEPPDSPIAKFGGESDTSMLVSVLARHAWVSACQLRCSRYEIVLEAPLVPHIMKNEYLRSQVRAGYVSLLVKVAVPRAATRCCGRQSIKTWRFSATGARTCFFLCSTRTSLWPSPTARTATSSTL